jgi:type IV secretory pathway TraG/TraD family ATPase VirD4
MAKCQIPVAFAVNDLDTAEMLSKRLGDETVLTRSFGVSSGADAVLSHHQNMGQGEHGRRLLQPNEILHLPEHQALVTMQGLGLSGPLRVTRITYWTEPMFAGQYGRWKGSGVCAAHAVVFGEEPEAAEMAPAIGYEPVRQLTFVEGAPSCVAVRDAPSAAGVA